MSQGYTLMKRIGKGAGLAPRSHLLKSPNDLCVVIVPRRIFVDCFCGKSYFLIPFQSACINAICKVNQHPIVAFADFNIERRRIACIRAFQNACKFKSILHKIGYWHLQMVCIPWHTSDIYGFLFNFICRLSHNNNTLSDFSLSSSSSGK